MQKQGIQGHIKKMIKNLNLNNIFFSDSIKVHFYIIMCFKLDFHFFFF